MKYSSMLLTLPLMVSTLSASTADLNQEALSSETKEVAIRASRYAGEYFPEEKMNEIIEAHKQIFQMMLELFKIEDSPESKESLYKIISIRARNLIEYAKEDSMSEEQIATLKRKICDAFNLEENGINSEISVSSEEEEEEETEFFKRIKANRGNFLEIDKKEGIKPSKYKEELETFKNKLYEFFQNILEKNDANSNNMSSEIMNKILNYCFSNKNEDRKEVSYNLLNFESLYLTCLYDNSFDKFSGDDNGGGARPFTVMKSTDANEKITYTLSCPIEIEVKALNETELFFYFAHELGHVLQNVFESLLFFKDIEETFSGIISIPPDQRLRDWSNLFEPVIRKCDETFFSRTSRISAGKFHADSVFQSELISQYFELLALYFEFKKQNNFIEEKFLRERILLIFLDYSSRELSASIDLSLRNSKENGGDYYAIPFIIALNRVVKFIEAEEVKEGSGIFVINDLFQIIAERKLTREDFDLKFFEKEIGKFKTSFWEYLSKLGMEPETAIDSVYKEIEKIERAIIVR